MLVSLSFHTLHNHINAEFFFFFIYQITPLAAPAITVCELTTLPSTRNFRTYAFTSSPYTPNFRGRPRGECGNLCSFDLLGLARKGFLILLTVLFFPVFCWNEQQFLLVHFHWRVLHNSHIRLAFFFSRGTINLFFFLIAYSCNMCVCLVGDLKRVRQCGRIRLFNSKFSVSHPV